ncbi:MAG: PilZ domain-containing protein [Spirochaetaceae bacterium]
MTDKRKHTRYTVMCKAECINTEVTVLDMSREGMRIKSSFNLNEKGDISFCIILPDLDIINIVGEIMWNKKIEDDEFYYGIKINSILGEHESSFLSFLNELK